MKILTRYILKEMLAPTALGFAFYTFIILMRQLFDLAGMIIKRSLPASTVLELLWLSLPNIIVLTIPMSLLFGILIAVGRLSADSEIISMRALGISTRMIYRPVFIFSFLMFLLNFYLMNVLLPWGNTRLQALRAVDQIRVGNGVRRSGKEIGQANLIPDRSWHDDQRRVEEAGDLLEEVAQQLTLEQRRMG